MPPVAFSSLSCARSYQNTEGYRVFLEAFQRAKEWVQSAGPDEVAKLETEFFPDLDSELLASTIQRYQTLGCWQGGVQIPKELYEQALNVFQAAGGLAWRHKYEEVVA